MKQFMKVLIWIVILGAVLFGVYTILPEYPQSFMKSFVQPVVDAQAKTRIEQVKALKNKDVDASYQEILEHYTNTSCWVYEQGAGNEIVTFYGKGASINIKDVPNHEDHLYPSTAVKFEFVITGNNVEIKAYIEDNLQDETIRDLMISQLYAGGKK
ncbi:MAG: hypothetical protein K2L07_03760 [Lachnospiraceae bacterium]|nr:hypothetical protein [Lachnospiraceae bacterium]